jgi:MFS transporter, NNP family, nitrate/nitrite transporter
VAREEGSRGRATAGGIAIGAAAGWNLAALGPVATRESHAYGVGLATIGLFLTVQFVLHMAMQIPGGHAADRWGARRSSAVGLAILVVGNAVALPAATPALGFLGRAIVGVGTGLAFIGGSDYIRAQGGSPTLQGMYGGSSVLAPGVAVAVIPAVATWTGFRAPYLSTIVVVLLAAALLALAPDPPHAERQIRGRLDWSFVRDSRLYRLAAIHSFSFGFSVIVGNWVVTLLEHHGQTKTAAAAVGSLTLLLGFFTRIAGGWLLRRENAGRIVAASLVLGGVAAAVLALPLTLPGYVAAATVLGLAAGVPFARAFTGAAAARPEAPGAAVGFVNAWAALTVVAGTPLVGLTFSLPGDGRIGFVVLGALAALASLATPR